MRLEKDDAKYLMIGRGTAFLDYDIEHDRRLRTMFETAGCGSLFGYIKLFVYGEDDVKNSAQLLIIFSAKQIILYRRVYTEMIRRKLYWP